jgi:lactate dehydrogenase-like 2-hydroxyacid dehydrogenase
MFSGKSLSPSTGPAIGRPDDKLAGGLCGIFSFGGIGAATARLMHGIGMRVHAINRHGRTDERASMVKVFLWALIVCRS